ncbi:MAG: hypothetical protein JW768_11525 [Chitinispirillaceae bacterium]|nr:hypothetical protein [Chitinispirillaceae bacterium]
MHRVANYRRTGTALFAGAILLLATITLHANGLRVDIDYLSPGRTDMYTLRWHNWAPASATTVSTVFSGITVTFRNAGSSGAGIKCGWYKGLLTTGATLTVDGLTIEEGTSNCAMEMVISGLAAGKHSLVTWHSFYDNMAGSPMDISVNGAVKTSGIRVPTRVANDVDAVRAYVEFDAQAGTNVVVKFSSSSNVVLNAFEIDGTDPAKKISKFTPAEGDDHYAMENGLNWTAAQGALSHDVYLGEDSASVDNATTTSPEFKANQSSAKYTLSGLSTFTTYWWRVDEKFSGSVTKGDVLPFRVRRLAFPTAMGYGRFTRGGRGGRVVEVTNLNDDGSGSLRHALVTEKGPRTIVFRVGGVVPLSSKLIIPSDGGDVYVAGQTAPGDGICVTRYAMGPLGSKDVIIRNIRLRVGDYAQDAMDGMGMASCDHCIIDHCSISWSVDEAYSSRGAKNITYQRNLVSEALNNSVHFNGEHSFAASISGKYGSFLFNLHAHCAGRNWSLAGGMEQDAKTYGGYVEIINNVVYNWRHRTTDGGVRQCNFIGNYYKAGPASTLMQLASIDGDELNTGDMQKAYIVNNKMVNASGSVLLNPNSDNWSMCISKFNTVAEVRSNSPLFPVSVTPKTPDEAYADVLANVGAIKPKLDPIDTRVIREARNGTYTYTGSKDGYKGILDAQDDAGGYPTMTGGTPPTDTDHDGMPDAWETAHNLNPNNAEDRNNTNLSLDQYTNLEMYLNELAGDPLRWNTTALKRTFAVSSPQAVRVTGRGLILNLPPGTRVIVERLDLCGRTIEILYQGELKQNITVVPHNQERVQSSTTYLLRVKGEGIEQVVPMVRVR